MKRNRYSYVDDVASEEKVLDKILFLLNVVAADPKVVEKKIYYGLTNYELAWESSEIVVKTKPKEYY